MLESLPDSLDETYEWMLCKIDSHFIDDARRVLTFLCFTPKPMSVSGLIDGIAVNTKDYTGLNKKRRLQSSNDTHQICLGLVEIGIRRKIYCLSPKEAEDTSIIRIVHFSIGECLASERIQRQKATIFSLNSVTVHAKTAEIHLTYLLENAFSTSTLEEEGTNPTTLRAKFSLIRYAIWFGYDHYDKTTGPVPELDLLVIQLFQRQRSFAT